ncbi:aldose epimerase family protein [Oceanobacillus sp. M60]
MNIQVKEVVNGWKEYTLTNDTIEISILDYGGIITKLYAPDRNGNEENIVWTFKDYHDYENNPLYLGALIGRVSGRIPDGRLRLISRAGSWKKMKVTIICMVEQARTNCLYIIKPFQMQQPPFL